MPTVDFHFITAACYLFAAFLGWLPRRATAPAAAAGAAPLPAPGRRGLDALIAIVLVVTSVRHLVEVAGDLIGGAGFNLSFATSLSLIVAITMVMYTLLSLALARVDLVARWLAPCAAAAAALPALLPAQHLLPYGGQPLFKVHFIVAMLAYSLFTVATLHALLMGAVERWLHQGAVPASARGLPPLMRMETLLFRLLLGAFVLLTLTLLSGVFFAEEMFGKAFQLNYKTVFGFLSWGIFAWLLYGHWKFGWRGRKAARLTMIGFVLLVLAYVGTKFVAEILLGRT